MKFYHYLIYLITIGSLIMTVSCDAIDQSLQRDSNSKKVIKPIASVNGKILGLEEILKDIPDYATKKDSTIIADTYLENWILAQLMYDRAKTNHRQKDNIEQLVERYRRALYILNLEEEIINESKTERISPDKINNFYSEFKFQDLLVEDIYKLKILIFPSDTKSLNKFERGWNKEDQTIIDQYKPSASYIQLDTSIWHTSSDIINLLPTSFSISNLKSKGLVKSKINNQSVYLNIYKKEKLGTEAPLSYIYSKIEKILIYKRQRETIKRYKEDLYSQALSNKKIEIFKN